MITAQSQTPAYATVLDNGQTTIAADAGPEDGGAGQGFEPHDLLQAALAACMNITLRWYADRNDIPLTGVRTIVNLNKDNPEVALFEYRVELSGDLDDTQRQRLLKVADRCPVHKTLERTIRFAPQADI